MCIVWPRWCSFCFIWDGNCVKCCSPPWGGYADWYAGWPKFSCHGGNAWSPKFCVPPSGVCVSTFKFEKISSAAICYVFIVLEVLIKFIKIILSKSPINPPPRNPLNIQQNIISSGDYPVIVWLTIPLFYVLLTISSFLYLIYNLLYIFRKSSSSLVEWYQDRLDLMILTFKID